MRALVLAGLLSSWAWAGPAEELVARNLEARGGAEKIRAIGSLLLTGIYRAGDTEMDYRVLWERGGHYRGEVTLQGLTAIEALDGQEAWQLDPFGGRRDAERLSDERARVLALEADLEGPLVDYAAKGHKLEYLGIEDVDGTAAHKLKLATAGGDTLFVYLDPDYFLEIRTIRQTNLRGVERVEEIDFSNYERVAGVYFPFSIEMGSKGEPKRSRILIEKAEVNMDHDDSLFKMP